MISKQYSYMLYVGLLCCIACQNTPSEVSNTTAEPSPSASTFTAQNATPTMDGIADDSCWQKGEWLPINECWLGNPVEKTDFSGRYKLAWDKQFLYVLAEIEDDTLIDIYPDGLVQYWDDDCLEIFVDEDGSKGNHQYNYNAFAYHISLDGKATDMGPDSLAHYYNKHLLSKRTQQGKKSTWETAIRLYPSDYEDGKPNMAATLASGKQMGFAIAYCDNDRSKERENFIGSVPVAGTDKNRGWIDAGIFGLLRLE